MTLMRAPYRLLVIVVACVGCAVESPAPSTVVKVEDTKPQAEVAETPALEIQESKPGNEAPAAVAEVAKAPEEEVAAVAAAEGPVRRTAFYRADETPAKMPAVALSKGHEALCKVKVGDQMPDISLPQLGGEATKLSSLLGDKATVVVFWRGDRRMAREQLADLGPDVIEPFGKSGVTVVGVAVDAPEADVQAALKAAQVDFTNLLDADGKVFAEVGSEKLPRTYLLDPQGKVLWFDIEYSLGTRRELHEALRTVAGDVK